MNTILHKIYNCLTLTVEEKELLPKVTKLVNTHLELTHLEGDEDEYMNQVKDNLTKI